MEGSVCAIENTSAKCRHRVGFVVKQMTVRFPREGGGQTADGGVVRLETGLVRRGMGYGSRPAWAGLELAGLVLGEG